MFTEAIFTIAKTWKQSKCLSTEVVYINTIQWNITQPKKKPKWNTAICSNMSGPREYYK